MEATTSPTGNEMIMVGCFELMTTEGEKVKEKHKKGDVSWSNIHITNEVREGLLVEVFIQHPGQTSAKSTEQQEGRREKRLQ